MAKKDSSINIWIRWIFMFPASVVAYQLVFLVAQILHKSGDDSKFNIDITIPMIAGLSAGYAFIWVGAQIAPSYKKNTAFLLLVIILIFGSIDLYFSFKRKDTFKMFELITVYVGSILGYKHTENEHPD